MASPVLPVSFPVLPPRYPPPVFPKARKILHSCPVLDCTVFRIVLRVTAFILCPGSGSFSIEDLISVCRSLRRIAEHARHTVEIGDFFHDAVIPRLLGLSLQAALHSKYFYYLYFDFYQVQDLFQLGSVRDT